jgi:Chaperone of endosialidase/YadA head domain repeat (2 copies)
MKGFGSASKDRNINASLTSLCLIGGTDCDSGLTPDLTIAGGAVINKTLCVYGNTELGNISAANDLLVCGNVHFKQDLVVDDNTVTGSLGVMEDALIIGNLQVLGDIIGNVSGNTDNIVAVSVTANTVVVNDMLTVEGDAQIVGDLEVCGNITSKIDVNVGGEITVEGDIIGNSDLCIDGDGKFTGDLYVGGNVMAPFVNIQGNCILSNDTDAMVCVYDGGAVDINTTSLDINGPTNINDDTTITGTTVVNGETTINDSLNVSDKITSDSVCANTLEIFEDTNIGGNLSADNIFANALSILDNTLLCGDVVMKANTQIVGDLEVLGNIIGLDFGGNIVSQSITANTIESDTLTTNVINANTLNVLEDTTLNDVTVNGNLQVVGTTQFDSNINVDAKLTVDDLCVTNNVDIDGDLNVDGETTLGNTSINNLTVTENTQIVGDLEVLGNIIGLDFGGNIVSQTIMSDTITSDVINANVVNANTLNVVDDSVLCGDVLIKGNLEVQKNTQINGDLEVLGTIIGLDLGNIEATTVNSDVVNANTLNVVDDSTLCGNVLIKGDLDIQGILKVDEIEPESEANVTVNSDLIVDGNITLNDINSTGEGQFDGNVNIDGKLTANMLCVTGDTSFFGNVFITGNLEAGVQSFSAGTTGLTPSTEATGVVVLGGTLNTSSGGTGLSSLGTTNQILGVNGAGTALEFKDDLSLAGDASFGGNVAVDGNLIVAERSYLNDVVMNGNLSGDNNIVLGVNDLISTCDIVEDWVKRGSDIDGEEAGDRSGDSVSLSADGNTVAIGATLNDGNGIDSGHTRVFDYVGTGWVQRGSDIDGEAAGDRSGYSVSLSADGNTVAIGAFLNDGNGYASGHMRIFDYVGTDWVQRGSDIDGETTGDQSGLTVALSADGSTVAMGAPWNDDNGTNSGHTRVFDYLGSDWVQRGSDIDGEAVDDFSSYSGVSLSEDGSVVAIGAYLNDGGGYEFGHTRIFDYVGTDWVKRGSDIDGEAYGDLSGHGVSLSYDGNTVAIGAFYNSGNGTYSGHTRVFDYVGTDWVQRGSDIDGESAFDNSGFSVSLSADGNTVAIGAPFNSGNGTYSGHTRVFDYAGTDWVQRGSDIDGEAASDRSGYSVSLSADGSTVASTSMLNDGNGSDSGHTRIHRFETVCVDGVDFLCSNISNVNAIYVDTLYSKNGVDPITVPDGLIVNGTLDVTGLTTLTNVNITTSATFGGNVAVSGNADILGKLTTADLCVTGTADLSAIDITTDDLTVNGNLQVVGTSQFDSNVNIDAKLTVDELCVIGDSTLSGNLDMDCFSIHNVEEIHVGNVFGKSPINIHDTLYIRDTGTGGNIWFESGIVIGKSANVSGTSSLAIGNGAKTAGSNSITIGDYSYSGTGTENIVIGSGTAGNDSATGRDNIFMGDGTAFYATSGSYNVAIGYSTAYYLETGGKNIAIGYEASYSLVNGSYNIAIGYDAGAGVTSGDYNITIGRYSGYVLGSSNYAIAIGDYASYKDTTSGQIAIGRNAMKNWDYGSNTYMVAIGTDVLQNAAGGNEPYGTVAIGYKALNAATTVNGYGTVAIGRYAMGSTTTFGVRNTAVGGGALEDITGRENAGFGYGALNNFTSGDYNVAIGVYALLGKAGGTATGDNNIAVGKDSLRRVSTGSDNISIGKSSMSNSEVPSKNIAIGSNTLDAVLTTGSDLNVAIGHQSMTLATGATKNTAVGGYSLDSLTTGDNNTALGYKAGDLLTTGSSNITIGYSADGAATISNQIVIGTTASASAADAIAIGRNSTASSANSVAIGAGATTTIGSSIALGYNSSVTSASRAFGLNINSSSINTSGSVPYLQCLVNGDEYEIPLAVVTSGGNVDLTDINCGNIGNVQAIFVDQLFGKNSPINIEDDLNFTVDGNAMISFPDGTASGQAGQGIQIGSRRSWGLNGPTYSNYFTHIAIGHGARAVANGGDCIAMGFRSIATGVQNPIAIGREAYGIGDGDVAIGFQALNTAGLSGSGGYNVGIGAETSRGLDGGANNVAIGHLSGTSVASGDENVFIGYRAGVDFSTGNQNIGIGTDAGRGNNIKSYSIAIGSFSYANNDHAIAIGSNVGSVGNKGAIAGATNAIAIGKSTEVTVQDGVAIGNGASSTAEKGIAIGYQSDASGGNSIVIGTLSSSIAADSIAIGINANSSSQLCIAIGKGSVASDRSIAIGSGTQPNDYSIASGYRSIAIGHDVVAEADTCISIGQNVVCRSGSFECIGIGSGVNLGFGGQVSYRSVCIGYSTYASGNLCVVLGSDASCQASGGGIQTDYAIAIGKSAEVKYGSHYSIALGPYSEVEPQSTYSMAIGYRANARAGHTGQISMGKRVTTDGNYAIAIGGGTSYATSTRIESLGGVSNDGEKSIAIGFGAYVVNNNNCIAIGTSAHVQKNVATFNTAQQAKRCITIGYATKIENSSGVAGNGDDSIVIGTNAQITGSGDTSDSIVIGTDATSAFTNTVVIGKSANASSNGSIAIGRHSEASTGTYAIAIGAGASSGAGADAIAADAIAIGRNSTAAGTRSTAIGVNSQASMTDAVAIGDYSNATGYRSVSIGPSTASGTYAIAIGFGSVVNSGVGAAGAIALGTGSIASTRCVVLGSKHTGIPSIYTGVTGGAIESVAIGFNSKIIGTASVQKCIVIGSDNNVTGPQSTAIGVSNNISHLGCFALGILLTSARNSQILLSLNARQGIAGEAFAVFNPINNELTYDTSSIRFKNIIGDLDDISDKFDQLNAVRFVYKDPDTGNVHPMANEQIGFIAEDMANIFPEFTVYEDNECTIPSGINYPYLTSMLTKQLQTERQTIKTQGNLISDLSDLVASQGNLIADLQSRVIQLESHH